MSFEIIVGPRYNIKMKILSPFLGTLVPFCMCYDSGLIGKNNHTFFIKYR